MKTRTRPGQKRDLYLELVYQFPLRPIRSDRELNEASRVIDALLDRGRLKRAESDYLEVLSGLVEKYEAAHHAIPPLADAELLRYLIAEKGRTQAMVAHNTGIAESTISEILAGTRSLNRTQIGKLSAYFHVEPGVFRFG